ncbi:MAG TPA: sensor domain-containing diguanylate cyclase [Castellaniella sp.]|uniref:sensor domain-containing diguanylate cyclase n=1 Tax=Castellaniella sp. TaxID=1955812 RepID=UPI002F1046C1
MSAERQVVAGSGFGILDFFEVMPMPLWLEDYSELFLQFERWRKQGVSDLGEWLREDRSRVQHCARLMRVLRVNRRTLELYEADSQDHLMGQLPSVLRDDMLDGFAGELVQMWTGSRTFHSVAVNYTLSGRRLDLSLKGVMLADAERPWDRILVAMEDITELQDVRRQAQTSAGLAREFFEQAPVSLWVEDFSKIKRLLDDLRVQGIVDFRTFINVHGEFVDRCMDEIRVVDVNGYTLDLYKAQSRAELLSRLDEVFREEMRDTFAEQLIELWEGRLFHQKEVRNRTLQGDLLHIHLQLSVFKGHEDDWELVLLALTDITARKKAEAYLEYLGQHDVLTQLKNRSFFVDELGRLSHKRTPLVGFVALDLNDLKFVNDEQGHAAGDDLLRRFGEVLNKAVDRPATAARIGGDEFMVVLPGMDEAATTTVLNNIRSLVVLNNQYYSGPELSVSAGISVCRDSNALEKAMREADRAMYEDKRSYYEEHGRRLEDRCRREL